MASSAACRVRKQARTISDSCSSSLIQDEALDHSSQTAALTLPLSSTTAIDLEKTYSYKNAISRQGGGQLHLQQGSDPAGHFVKIFLALERIDQKIDIHQVLQRICCYVFAQLHKRGSSVDQIVQEVKDALPLTKDTSKRFTISSISALGGWQLLSCSRPSPRWPDNRLLGSSTCFSRVRGEYTRGSGHLPCSSGLSWERASKDKCQLALNKPL